MIVALIPARGGSVRIPDKNIIDLAGVPLVSWSIGSAQAAVVVDEIVVSSDDERTLALARELGVTPHERHPDSATDDATDWDVISDCLNGLLEDPEFIIYLRPTTPLRRSAWIDEAMGTFRAIKSATALRSVHAMSETAHKCLQIEPGYILETIEGRREIDLANGPNHHYRQTFRPNGAVDIVRPRVIREGMTFGDNCYGYITPWTVEIDTPTDLEYARFLAGRGNDARLRIEMA